mmetsp:Transcript_2398/g.4527  ORF Transcript_2398/g.4527 Transcript_2398/m.4527 type:complete len:426 (-) Transcript_2398:653-1930(-)
MGDKLLLVLTHDLVLLLEPPDDPVGGLLEVDEFHRVLLVPSGDDGRLVAQVGDVGTSEARRQGREAFGQVLRLLLERQRLQVHFEDLPSAVDVWLVYQDLTVEAARSQKGAVENVCAVRAGQHHHARLFLEAVHLDEELVQRVLALIIAPGEAPLATAAPHSVNLVDEHNAGGVLARLREQVAHTGRTHADEHLDEVGPRHAVERHVGLASGGLGQQRLTRTRRANEQGSLGDFGPELREALRLPEEAHELHDLDLGLIETRYVLEPGLDLPGRGDDGGVGPADGEDVATVSARAAGHAAHVGAEEPEDSADQDQCWESAEQLSADARDLVDELDGNEVALLDAHILLDLLKPAFERLDRTQVEVVLAVHGGRRIVAVLRVGVVATTADDVGDALVHHADSLDFTRFQEARHKLLETDLLPWSAE